MPQLTNSPNGQLGVALERRKSWMLRVRLKYADGQPVVLAGYTLRMVVKAEEFDEDEYDSNNLLVNSEARVSMPEMGEALFELQAAELDWGESCDNSFLVAVVILVCLCTETPLVRVRACSFNPTRRTLNTPKVEVLAHQSGLESPCFMPQLDSDSEGVNLHMVEQFTALVQFARDIGNEFYR